MKKKIFTIIIVALLVLPLVLFADKPIFTDDDGSGGWTGGGGTGGNGGTTTTSGTSVKSRLSVTTKEASNITYTTAILHGTGSDTIANPILPITAYFRYSKSSISPIFCNDIYGTNMTSTSDIKLGTTYHDKENKKGNVYNQGSNSFYQKITDLAPDTTYYYCAIASNKENIAYGGSSIVKEFHTSPNKTSIKTSTATEITTSSATLNGSYSSVEDVVTYFEYRKVTNQTIPWETKGEKTYKSENYANIYGTISYDLTGLTPDTKYQFRTVGKNYSEEGDKIFYGATLSFTTIPKSNGEDTPDDPTNETCTNGATNYPECTASDNGYCLNGAVNYPTCTINTTYSCVNRATNPPACTIYADGTCTNGATNPPSCTTITGGGNRPTGGSRRDGGSNGGGGTVVNDKRNNNTTPKYLGQVINPPADAIVRSQEGIETVFARQILANQSLASTYGYKEGTDLQNFAWYLADELAKMFGYIDENGKEIRVSFPDIAAYQLQLSGEILTVYEYYDGKIIDIRNTTTEFKNKSDYEYYFKK